MQVNSPLPNGMDEPARRERERFEARYKKFLEESRRVSLSILVWGQNPRSGSALANKRMEICDELLRLGHNAMFSELLPDPAGDVSEKTKEFAQARAADLVIILVEEAPGALAEAHDFCNDPKIAPKVYVLIPKKYQQGYSSQGAMRDLSDAHGGVYWYDENELQRCDVFKYAVRRAEARRHLLFRAGKT